jgi:teichuronic acid exporter
MFLRQITFYSVSQILYLAVTPILSRIYSPSDFAEQSILLQITTFTSAVITLRFESFIPIQKTQKRAFGLINITLWLILINSVVLCLLWGICKIFAQNFSDSFINDKLFIFVTLLNICLPLSLAAQNLILREQNYVLLGRTEIASRIAQIVLALTCGLFFKQINGLVFSIALMHVVKPCVLLSKLKNAKNIMPTTETRFLKQLAKVNLIGSVSILTAHLLTSASTLLLSILFGKIHGRECLGQLSLILALVWMPSGIVSASVGNIYVREAYRLVEKGNPLNLVWENFFLRLLLIGSVIFIPLGLYAKPLIPLILGSKWHVAAKYGQILSVVGFLSFISTPFDKTSMIVKNVSYPIILGLYRLISTMLVFVISNIFLISDIDSVWLISFQLGSVYLIDLAYSYHQSR